MAPPATRTRGGGGKQSTKKMALSWPMKPTMGGTGTRAGVKRGRDGAAASAEPPARRRSLRLCRSAPGFEGESPSPRPKSRVKRRASAASGAVAVVADPEPRMGELSLLPMDLLLQVAGKLPPADLLALAATCRAAQAILRRAAWVRVFECVCLSAACPRPKNKAKVSPASPDGAVGPPRPLAGAARDPRMWYVGTHGFSAAAAEAEARRITKLITHIAATADRGTLVGVDVLAELRVAVKIGWAVWRGTSKALPVNLLGTLMNRPLARGADTVVYRVFPRVVACMFWSVEESDFAAAPKGGSGVPDNAALSTEMRTVGGLTRAAVRKSGGIKELLRKAEERVSCKQMAEDRAAANMEVMQRLAEERRLGRFPGALQVAIDSVSTIQWFVAGGSSHTKFREKSMAEALDRVSAAYEALSPTFLYKVMKQDGDGRWVSVRHWGWYRCLERCVNAASVADATTMAIGYEQSNSPGHVYHGW